jgi:holliday junction DNA helicase RuvB
MYKPYLSPLELGPALRDRIEPPIFEALFKHIAQHPPAKHVRGAPSLTVSQAKEILGIALPHYREQVAGSIQPLPQGNLMGFTDLGVLLHQWLHAAFKFFRREGAAALREALREPDEEQRYLRLWGALFLRCLLRLIQGSGLLQDPQRLESCDLAVECLKLWVRDLSRKIGQFPPEAFSPQAFFLDTESDLEGIIEWKGRKLHLRGKPDAVILNGITGRPEVLEYKFGLQGQIELQIAQVLLYLRLINLVKGQAFDTGRLKLFRIMPDTEETPVSQSEFPPRVDAAFQGYIGNHAAVRRLKIECTLALRQGEPPRMPVNLLFCGPGGLGKTELARRVARALELPLVDIPATAIKDVDALLQRIDDTLETKGREAVQQGTDSGLPLLKYPPLVIFLDEVHELRKKADAFLPMFEPKEKRAVGKRIVGDFKDATLLAATTDKGLLPGPFLSRFRIIDLVPYTAEEVAAIISPVFQEKGKRVNEDFLLRLAKMSRLNPRIALQCAEEMLSTHTFDDQAYPLSLPGLQRLSSEQWQVDEHGLNNNDRRYLGALKSGPKGLNSLVQLLPVGRDEIVNVIEPYLLQLEAIRLTGNGRELTERGRLLMEDVSSSGSCPEIL